MSAAEDETAACHGVSSAVFFPVYSGNQPDPRLDAAAKAICARCPVRQRCLDEELDAMRSGAPSVGIFGGLNERERQDLLGRRPPQQVVRHVEPIDHGNPNGVSAHRRRGEQPCDECRRARSEYVKRWKWWRGLLASLDTSVMRTLRAAALAESWRLRGADTGGLLPEHRTTAAA